MIERQVLRRRVGFNFGHLSEDLNPGRVNGKMQTFPLSDAGCHRDKYFANTLSFTNVFVLSDFFGEHFRETLVNHIAH